MSLVFSYFIIPVVVLLLLVNVYFRVKIIKKYNFLRNKNIQLAPKDLMNKTKREAYIAANQPEYAEELTAFASNLNTLVKMVIGGFVLILIGFAFIYFNQD